MNSTEKVHFLSKVSVTTYFKNNKKNCTILIDGIFFFESVISTNISFEIFKLI